MGGEDDEDEREEGGAVSKSALATANKVKAGQHRMDLPLIFAREKPDEEPFFFFISQFGP